MDVSRETMARLEAYVALLEKWNRKINLIGKSTKSDIWDRHIVDSAQVFDMVPACESWADLGTGAGLPGLVVAILAKEKNPDLRVVLIESDQRKAAFCKAVIRELGLSAEILAQRIEETPSLGADVVSARALAPLNGLLSYAEHHLVPGGVGLFPKGENWKQEVTESLASWRFSVETESSKTNPSAMILKIGDIQRV